MNTELSHSELDLSLVRQEFPRGDRLYLNFGSSGVKPTSVLAAVLQGCLRLNENPTTFTFIDTEPWDAARNSAAKLLDVAPQSLMLTQNTTQGLQLIMHSFLLKPGDELVTTNHEHGSLNTIARHLEEMRGIVIRRHSVEPLDGDEAMNAGLLELVNEKTKLVVVSEISSMTGWRPNLSALISELEKRDVPFLADGAHTPGQGNARPAKYPLWVGSGHKWLGGPSGTGFAYVAPHLVPRLEPVWLGDRFYERLNESRSDLTRFESTGTCDVVRWLGLARACELYLQMGDGASALLTFNFPAERVKTNDLRQALWSNHRIWTQPDFLLANPGHGIRISCHYSITRDDIEEFINALRNYVEV